MIYDTKKQPEYLSKISILFEDFALGKSINTVIDELFVIQVRFNEGASKFKRRFLRSVFKYNAFARITGQQALSQEMKYYYFRQKLSSEVQDIIRKQILSYRSIL